MTKEEILCRFLGNCFNIKLICLGATGWVKKEVLFFPHSRWYLRLKPASMEGSMILILKVFWESLHIGWTEIVVMKEEGIGYSFIVSMLLLSCLWSPTLHLPKGAPWQDNLLWKKILMWMSCLFISTPISFWCTCQKGRIQRYSNITSSRKRGHHMEGWQLSVSKRTGRKNMEKILRQRRSSDRPELESAQGEAPRPDTIIDALINRNLAWLPIERSTKQKSEM